MANRRSIEERIAQLEAQKKALQARLAKESRARDTRRKVLLGAFLMHRMETDIEQGDRLRACPKKQVIVSTSARRGCTPPRRRRA